MSSLYDPENEPEKAAYLAALCATGEYVDVTISCSSCDGGFTALAHRSVLEDLTHACVFCGSDDTTVTVLDMQEG
jgi:hypothetical protein